MNSRTLQDPPSDESQSHFAYFHQIVVELGQIASPSPPSWPAVENPVYDAANVVPGANLVDDPDVLVFGGVLAASAAVWLADVGRRRPRTAVRP